MNVKKIAKSKQCLAIANGVSLLASWSFGVITVEFIFYFYFQFEHRTLIQFPFLFRVLYLPFTVLTWVSAVWIQKCGVKLIFILCAGWNTGGILLYLLSEFRVPSIGMILWGATMSVMIPIKHSCGYFDQLNGLWIGVMFCSGELVVMAIWYLMNTIFHVFSLEPRGNRYILCFTCFTALLSSVSLFMTLRNGIETLSEDLQPGSERAGYQDQPASTSSTVIQENNAVLVNPFYTQDLLKIIRSKQSIWLFAALALLASCLEFSSFSGITELEYELEIMYAPSVIVVLFIGLASWSASGFVYDNFGLKIPCCVIGITCVFGNLVDILNLQFKLDFLVTTGFVLERLWKISVFIISIPHLLKVYGNKYLLESVGYFGLWWNVFSGASFLYNILVLNVVSSGVIITWLGRGIGICFAGFAIYLVVIQEENAFMYSENEVALGSEQYPGGQAGQAGLGGQAEESYPEYQGAQGVTAVQTEES